MMATEVTEGRRRLKVAHTLYDSVFPRPNHILARAEAYMRVKDTMRSVRGEYPQLKAS